MFEAIYIFQITSWWIVTDNNYKCFMQSSGSCSCILWKWAFYIPTASPKNVTIRDWNAHITKMEMQKSPLHSNANTRRKKKWNASKVLDIMRKSRLTSVLLTFFSGVSVMGILILAVWEFFSLEFSWCVHSLYT